jgi:nitroreductase
MDAFEAILARRSIRRFTAEDVSLEDERLLIDAAFAAPSSMNGRPWHFVVVRDPATHARLAQVHEWAGLLARAPLVIAVLARADTTYSPPRTSAWGAAGSASGSRGRRLIRTRSRASRSSGPRRSGTAPSA